MCYEFDTLTPQLLGYETFSLYAIQLTFYLHTKLCLCLRERKKNLINRSWIVYFMNQRQNQKNILFIAHINLSLILSIWTISYLKSQNYLNIYYASNTHQIRVPK